MIPEVTDPKEWVELTTGAWCYYDNDPANGEKYGKLYNWYAVNDPRGLAREGCHIPTIDEMMKKKWKNIIPGGYRYGSGAFYYVGDDGGWWSSTELSATHAWSRYMYYDYSYVYRNNYNKEFGFSVRCVKDKVRTLSVDEVKILLEKQKQKCANEFIHAEMTMEQAKCRVINAPTVSF